MNIRELAKEAGVSVATISRVINHPEAVLPETRERVQTIIEKYNYNPKQSTAGGGPSPSSFPRPSGHKPCFRGCSRYWRPRGFWSTWWSSLPFREE